MVYIIFSLISGFTVVFFEKLYLILGKVNQAAGLKFRLLWFYLQRTITDKVLYSFNFKYFNYNGTTKVGRLCKGSKGSKVIRDLIKFV